MNRLLCTTLVAVGGLVLSASPALAVTAPVKPLPKGCFVQGGTFADKKIADQFAHDGMVMSSSLLGSVPYTPKVVTPLRPGDASEIIDFLAVDTAGGLWHTRYLYEASGTKMTSYQLATKGYAGVMAMVASEYRAVKGTRFVYATTSVGTLVKYSFALQTDGKLKVTRVGQFKTQGWNTIRSMGIYYMSGKDTTQHRDFVLALGTDGQLRRYGIPATSESVLRTILKPSGWNSIAHVSGSLCPGRHRVDGAFLAYTTGGEARAYYDAKATDNLGTDIVNTTAVKPGFVGVHY